MPDDEPIKIAAYLIRVHGLDMAMDVVMKGIEKAHNEDDRYRLSVWREVKQILAAKAEHPSTEDD